ncbi:MAG: preprotein translocase subunit SecE [Victivallaceae bacterium]|nr:preprotein translocase subunit SecE [Victivallaceae bacterium]
MIRNWINKIKKFFGETWGEMLRCVWPGRQELLESTSLVIIVIIILALFVMVVDSVSGFVITKLTGGA